MSNAHDLTDWHECDAAEARYDREIEATNAALIGTFAPMGDPDAVEHMAAFDDAREGGEAAIARHWAATV
mgnify:CR=1 FL=1